MAGSPRVRRSPEERRIEIAAAARRLALSEGLVAVTMRQVAAEAGVTPALVAHYAPSMDELVAETFGGIVADELAELARLVGDRPDPVARLAALCATLLDGERDDVTLVWVQAWGSGGRNEPLAVRVRAEMDAWQAFVEGVLVDGVESGVFRIADAAPVAWQILGMIDGLNAQSLVRWGAGEQRIGLLARAVEALVGLPEGSLGAESAPSVD